MTRLFFYGVLIGELAPPPVRRLLAGLGPGRRAAARGRLYAIDDGPAGVHPAMVAGAGTVKGVVHEAGGVDLAALDRFEGADYARLPIVASVDDEDVEAEAYIWLRSTAGLAPISDGDFARWLRESGRPAFGH